MSWVIFMVIVFIVAFIGQMYEDKKKGTWGMSKEEEKYKQTMEMISEYNLPTGAFIQAAQMATDQFQADVNKKIENRQTTGAMVKGAVVGGIVGGEAGAVVGAMVGKENAKKK